MFQKMLQGGGGGSSEPITWETDNNGEPNTDYTITNKKGYKMYLFAYNAWVGIGTGEYGEITSISGGTILENSLIIESNAYFTGYTYVIDITEDTCTISFKQPTCIGAIFFKQKALQLSGGGTSGNYVVKEEHFMLPLGTTIEIGVDYVPMIIVVNFSTYALNQSFYIKGCLDFTNNTTGVLKSSNNETLTISYSNNAISISFTGSSAEVWNSTQTEMLIMTNA